MIRSDQLTRWINENPELVKSITKEAVSGAGRITLTADWDSAYIVASSTRSEAMFGSSMSVTFVVDQIWHSRDEIRFRFMVCPDGILSDRYTRISRQVQSDHSEPEAYFRAAVAEFKNRFQKEPANNGCVKAYTNSSKLAWLVKRSNSDKIVKIGDEYHLITPEIAFVHHENGETEAMLNNDPRMSRFEREYTYMSRRNHLDPSSGGYDYWHNSLLVPIYSSYSRRFDQLGDVILRVAPTQIEQQTGIHRFEQVTRPNGDVIYVQPRVDASGNSYVSAPIHSYSTRIESLIPEDELFLMGDLDLYRKRPLAEVPFLGWELEACDNLSEEERPAAKIKELMNRLVMCKADSSIRPRGFEVVSIPATLDFWKNTNLAETMNVARKAPYNMRSYEHSSCGFHVHVSRAALSVLDLQKLERFMHCPDNRPMLEAIAGRAPCTYANYYPDTFWGENRKKNRRRGGMRNTFSDVRGVTLGSLASGDTPSDDLFYRVYGNNLHETDGFVRFCRIMWAIVPINALTRGWNNGSFIVGSGRVNFEANYRPEFMSNLQLMYDNVAPASRPEFMSILRRCFPGQVFTFAAQETTPVETWKAGVRKTTKPVGRVNNYLACQQLEGNIGKQAAGRYDVLNTGNRNTVEFRLFKGTMNPTSIFRYLEFVDAIVRFLPTTPATDEGLKFDRFTAWLKSDTFNLLRYENLVAFLITKGYINRKDIRRRDLDIPVESDGPGLPGITATTTARTFEDELDDYEDEERDYDDYDEDGSEPGCNCEDCVAARGYEV